MCEFVFYTSFFFPFEKKGKEKGSRSPFCFLPLCSLRCSFATSRLALRAMASAAAASWSKRGGGANALSSASASAATSSSLIASPLLQPVFSSARRAVFSPRAAMLPTSSPQTAAALRSSRTTPTVSGLCPPRLISSRGVASAAAVNAAAPSDNDPLPPLPARPSRVPEPGKPYVITTPLYYVRTTED